MVYKNSLKSKMIIGVTTQFLINEKSNFGEHTLLNFETLWFKKTVWKWVIYEMVAHGDEQIIVSILRRHQIKDDKNLWVKKKHEHENRNRWFSIKRTLKRWSN